METYLIGNNYLMGSIRRGEMHMNIPQIATMIEHHPSKILEDNPIVGESLIP